MKIGDNLFYYYLGDPTCCRRKKKNIRNKSPDRGEVLPKSGIDPRKQLYVFVVVEEMLGKYIEETDIYILIFISHLIVKER